MYYNYQQQRMAPIRIDQSGGAHVGARREKTICITVPDFLAAFPRTWTRSDVIQKLDLVSELIIFRFWKAH